MGRTRNISKGGILMETHTRLQTGQQVMITLSLNNQLIEVMGKIVYTFGGSSMYHYGIEFHHIAENNRRAFCDYVTSFHQFVTETDQEQRDEESPCAKQRVKQSQGHSVQA